MTQQSQRPTQDERREAIQDKSAARSLLDQLQSRIDDLDAKARQAALGAERDTRSRGRSVGR